jgi:hypothetical protein
MSRLPLNHTLFVKFFAPWYDEDDRKRHCTETTRGDMIQCDDYRGLKESEACGLTKKCAAQVRRQIKVMVRAARSDWPRYLDVSGKIDLDWIRAFDAHYRPKQIREVIRGSDPKDFSNDYVVLCCEFGAVLGHVMLKMQPRLFWVPDWPYWESVLLDPESGNLVPVFHWAIKKMSGYGWDDGFAEKVDACLAMLDGE